MSVAQVDHLHDAADLSLTVERFELLGVPISVLNLETAVEYVRVLAARRALGASFICVRDINGIIACQSDPALREIHRQAALVTPDGMPVVWWGRYCGHSAVRRVYGPDLMNEVCLHSSSWEEGAHYLCGGAPGVTELLSANLLARYPKLRVVGSWTPPFRPLSGDEYYLLAEDIRRSGAKIIWVGLSSPKQERFMSDLCRYLDGGVLIGVGAAFDFLSGAKPQAPMLMQRTGTEWIFRLVTEPRRLWRRYLFGHSRFLWMIAGVLLRDKIANLR